MPELPEVEVVVRELNKLVLNKPFKNIIVTQPKMLKNATPEEFNEQLTRRLVESVERRGKFILFHLTDFLTVVSHLRMEGKYFYYEKPAEPAKHTHFIFQFQDGAELHYNDVRQFGTFQMQNTKTYLNEKPICTLGPEPRMAHPDKLFAQTRGKSIAIKSAILDQSIIAGIGNIYANEVLWASKINPYTPTNKLEEHHWKSIINLARGIFEKSISMGGSSIDTYSSINGVRGTYQDELKIHGHQGLDCPRCGVVIVKEAIGGRGTYYCPKCQPEIY